MKKAFWLLLVVLALSGCATFPRDTGFELASPRQDVVERRQEPWHNSLLLGDLSVAKGYQVAAVFLPHPVPAEWAREFADPSKTYRVKVGERRVSRHLERVVFRTALYDDAGRLETIVSALVGPEMNALFVLLPVTERYEGRQAYILSSDGKRALTLRGETADISGEELGHLRPEFLARHPSRIVQTIPMWRFDPDGETFLQELEQRFPTRLTFAGVKYSGVARETLVGLVSLTREDQPIDCLISNGRLAVFPGMTAVSLAFSLPRNIAVLAECGK